MSRLVAAYPKEMQLVEHDTRNNRDECVIVKELNQVCLIRTRQVEVAINGVDDLLRKSPEFDQRACRVGVSVLLRKGSKHGQLFPVAAQEFKVQRSELAHVHPPATAGLVPSGTHTILLHPVAKG